MRSAEAENLVLPGRKGTALDCLRHAGLEDVAVRSDRSVFSARVAFVNADVAARVDVAARRDCARGQWQAGAPSDQRLDDDATLALTAGAFGPRIRGCPWYLDHV